MTLQEVINILKERKEKADKDFEENGANLYDEVCIANDAISYTLEKIIALLGEVE